VIDKSAPAPKHHAMKATWNVEVNGDKWLAGCFIPGEGDLNIH